jgi:glycine/D-amino acid oxidase-like deaminating enzyme
VQPKDLSKEEQRIIVVGAGSTGSSVAYHIGKALGRGDNVILIDRLGIANGMTALSSAIVRTHYSNGIVARMALYSRDVMNDFGEIGTSGFTKCGAMFLFPREFREELEKKVAMLKSVGIDERLLDADEASKLFPKVNFEGIDRIAYEPDSGYAEPASLTQSYVTKSMGLGIELLRSSVVRIKSHRGGGSVFLDNAKEIAFHKLVLCTNVWTNQLLRQSGCDQLPIRVAPHPIVVFNRPAEYGGRTEIIIDLLLRTYYKPEGSNLLLGGTSDPHVDEVSIEPDDIPKEVPFEYITEYSEKIANRIPAMSGGTYRSAYYGMYDVTPDEHPIIDSLVSMGLDNVYCCVGLSGHGFKLSPAFGLITSELVLGREYTKFDGSVFSLGRFAGGRNVFRRYEGVGTIA